MRHLRAILHAKDCNTFFDYYLGIFETIEQVINAINDKGKKHYINFGFLEDEKNPNGFKIMLDEKDCCFVDGMTYEDMLKEEFGNE